MMDSDGGPRRGIVFILSAPSGAGKTTISRAALGAIAGLTASVSLTTRTPRAGEVEGRDYHFVSDEDFNRRVGAHEMAEWARVFDASYGTPRAPLDRAIAAGEDILLDIDIHGARQIRAKYPADAVTIFVLPPSFAELEGRLRGRGTEDEAAIGRRLKRAREEASAYPEYDYLIINAEVGDSIARLQAVVNAERLRVARLRGEFAPWKL
jgi:guanylate kinase